MADNDKNEDIGEIADYIAMNGVCEMKNKQKAFKQLHANMLHSQLVIQALKVGAIVCGVWPEHLL